jgi:MATE family multidrug resistance protein
LIGALGPAVIAGHQTALNFASLIFMLPAGLSAALSIRVAQALGSGDKVAARFVAWCGMALALCLAVVITPALIWLRGDIAAMYSPDADVQAVAARLLLFAAAWHWADALQVCAAGALRGYRVTLAPMLVMIAAYWALALPLGALLARHGWPTRAVGAMGVDGYWAGLLVGLVVVAAALTAWLYRVANRGLESAR